MSLRGPSSSLGSEGHKAQYGGYKESGGAEVPGG